ncbi:glycine--tRNA ligase subunit beta [Dentiradicibacter hellwigii]|uniref:Glycine--tRNA ligase beta subunit n=1 Tax=Dentiradicibacter hellwigii TaxID=3149053 RepID=A0ABV4UCF9_9RHOO
MSTNNLLVELFVEELPPKALKKLGEAFASTLAEALIGADLAAADARVTAYATPRRLAAHITNVLSVAPERAVSTRLMPVSVGLDAAGQATPALRKKLASLGLEAADVSQLRRAHDGKVEALFHDSRAPGATLADGLQKALDTAIAALPIPKVMAYQLHAHCAQPGWTTVHFVRPAHGLVALHGRDVVPVSALGLTAGRTTHGHRFEAAADPLDIADADAYAATLKEQGAVIASYEERCQEIVRQIRSKANALKCRLEVEPAHLTDGAQEAALLENPLVQEVTALVEWPNVLPGQFEETFLEVPQECLILTMKANQKYFPLLDDAGRLTNRFLIVANIRPDDERAVIEGNERVVRPRLADAKFFFDQDRKKTLESRIPELDKVVYHNKLGTQGERSLRVAALAKAIAGQLGGALAQPAERAASLAKADLLTGMVGEFPELQGIMGRYYALHDGLAPEIADAIEDHYKPRFAGDELPRGQVGTIVALADKLETLVGLFGIGQMPTGDKDPFALRRHALGVIRMLIEKDLPLEVSSIIEMAREVHNDEAIQRAAHKAAAGGDAFTQRKPFDPATSQQVLDFIYERLAGVLREQGYSAQEVDAVLSRRPQHLAGVAARLAAVRAFSALPEAAALAAANKRVSNILKKAGPSVTDDANVDPALLRESAEQALAAALAEARPKADAAFEQGDYTASLQALAALRAPVDAFFADVMVNADDPALKANRLALLAALHAAMNRVADLSRLQSA